MTRLAVALVVAVAAAAPLAAHHSFPAYYFEDQSVTIEGDLVEFDYRTPHAWVHVNVRDAQGRTERYSAEWSNPNRLQRDNITRDTLRTGDRLIITGSPGRIAAERRLHLKAVERPADGWRWRSGGRR